MKKLLQFGAGNIGRSFVGQLFSKAGYEVVFVDVDEPLIQALNSQGQYKVEIRDKVNSAILVKNIRAVDAFDTNAVVREMVDADVCATAVGPKVLPKLFNVFAEGLEERHKAARGPVDFILCENLRSAAEDTRAGLKKRLPADFPVDSYVGLVETSIGKMVPIIPPEIREKDPTTVYAEAYNTLILDKKGFINAVPEVDGLAPKDNMKAYVDRKSFIHNLGHAALAYITHLVKPQMVYTYEAVEDKEIRSWVKSAMWESGNLLIRLYPDEFNKENQEEHIEDLLDRFGNRILGDTIHRVGRDLIRKLSPGDRVAGPLLKCWSHDVNAPWIGVTLACGLLFQAPDPEGNPFPADRELVNKVEKQGAASVLSVHCGVREPLISMVARAHSRIQDFRNEEGIIKRNHVEELYKFMESEMKNVSQRA
jgi:mannitol-1-phosphate 5-dehydrogenase